MKAEPPRPVVRRPVVGRVRDLRVADLDVADPPDFIDKPPLRARPFGGKYHNSTVLSGLTFTFMAPTYAIEQMICLGLLPREDDELVQTARGGACVTGGAAQDLADRIVGRRRRTRMPASAVPLRVASRRIGGREKPWGAIFERLRSGDVECWIDGDAPTFRSVMVHPTSLAAFQQVVFRREDHPGFPFSPGYAKCEVEEVLNQALKRSKDLIERGDLAFGVAGGRHVANCDRVIDLAARIASFAELAAHTGLRYHDAADEMERLGVPRVGASWCRPTLVDHGLIPSLPAYRPTFPTESRYVYRRQQRPRRK